MNDNYILDNDGNPIVENNLQIWGNWMEINKRQIADSTFDNVRVSTVFLGLNYNYGEGNPILFETMIFNGKHDQYQKQFETKEAALIGHAIACNLAQEV